MCSSKHNDSTTQRSGIFVTIRDLAFDRESVPWMAKGNCTDPSIDPDWFFPDSEHENNIEQRMALDMCKTCPVKMNCLAYALNNWPVYGIWGGMRNKQLKDLARQIKEQK